MRNPLDKRGGRQYDLKRVRTTDLAPGLRTVVSEFETAAREHAFKGAANPEEWDDIDKYFDRKKQTLIRKLLRMQNGEELMDVEQLKRTARKMARMIYNIKLVIEQHKKGGIIQMDSKLFDDFMGLVTASPEIMAEVEKVIGRRRAW